MIANELYIKLDQLIVSKKNGNIPFIAKKLGITTRSTKHMIEVLKYRYNCPIMYSKVLKSYEYTDSGSYSNGFNKPVFDVVLSELDMLRKKIESLSKK